MTPKDIGKLAHQSGINSPTLDQSMMDWMSRNPDSSKIDQFILWWEGWFEALDENLNFRDVSFTSSVSALH